MSETSKVNISRNVFLPFLSFLFLSLILITLGSQNSFLYRYNSSFDVNCFITTARCMMRGDVLYRDVYEHKGPILYFIYIIGLKLTPHSMTGVYSIEVVFFTVFLFFSDRITQLYTHNIKIRIFSVCFTGCMASLCKTMWRGGECEELVLPLLTVSLYLVMKQEKKRSGEPYKPYVLFICGICFALVFWMKYTLTGFYIGLVLYLTVCAFRNKKIVQLLVYGMEFLAGALIGSLPVAGYFFKHKSFAELWDVYFYTLIFKYGGEKAKLDGTYTTVKAGNLLDFFDKFITPFIFDSLIVFLIGIVLKRYRKEAIMLLTIFFFHVAGVSAGVSQVYDSESLRFILPVAVLFFIYDIREIMEKLCSQQNENIPELRKYALKLKAIYEKVYLSHKVLCGVMAVLVFAAYFAVKSPVWSYLSVRNRKTVQESAAEIIAQSGVSEPKIICAQTLDQGLYYLTDTYPPDRKFCSYNMYTVEELGYYEKYLNNGYADFIVSVAYMPDLDGYTIVMSKENKDSYENYPFFLYARDDIV